MDNPVHAHVLRAAGGTDEGLCAIHLLCQCSITSSNGKNSCVPSMFCGAAGGTDEGAAAATAAKAARDPESDGKRYESTVCVCVFD